MRTICSREIFTKNYRQQQNFDSDPNKAWHYNHVTFTPIAKNFMLFCRFIYMLSMLYVRLTIKVKVGIPESFKVPWYPHKITGSSHLKERLVLFRLFKKKKIAVLIHSPVRCLKLNNIKLEVIIDYGSAFVRAYG